MGRLADVFSPIVDKSRAQQERRIDGETVDVNVGKAFVVQFRARGNEGVEPPCLYHGVALAGEPPVAVVHPQGEVGIGVVGGLDEQGGEVVEGAAVVQYGAIDG